MRQYNFRRNSKEISRLLAADKEPIDERGTIVVAKLSGKKYLEYEEQMEKQRLQRLAQEIMLQYPQK